MDYSNNTSIKALDKLKEKLLKGEMSLLIGSGFSKNVSDKFPDWSELLNDMIYEMYKPEISFLLKSTRLISDKMIELSSPKVQKIIKEIIDREGYLKIVSQYMERKGFRESIDAYIEEHIPYVEKDANTETYKLKYLHSNTKNETLTPDCLDLHKKILKMNWNNFFTTNYDNCLECAYEDRKFEIEDLEKEIKEKNKVFENIRAEIRKIEKTIVKLENNLKVDNNELEKAKEINLSDGIVSISNKTDENITQKISQLQVSINSKREEIWKSEDKIKNLKSIYRRRISEIEYLNEEKKDKIAVVKDSSVLDIQKTRNLIYLHGSMAIRNDSTSMKKRGFDNDIHLQYIISNEDYQKYPLKHEAFTQLMRISLLQDSFCLLGFSGIDPNFIAWIGWVRDIIERKTNYEENQDLENKHKIYLIDIVDNEVPVDRKIFYENHRIVRIPLQSKDVISFLQDEVKTISSYKHDSTGLISMLLEYLDPEEETDSALSIAVEKNKRLEYEKLWDRIYSINWSPKLVIDVLLNSIDRMWALKPFYRIYSAKQYKQNACEGILKRGKDYQSLIDNDKVEYYYRVLYLSFKDAFYLLSQAKDSVKNKLIDLNEGIVSSHLYQHFKLLELRDAILLNNKLQIDTLQTLKFDAKFKDDLYYEKALNLAYNFKFSELKNHLEEWNPESHFIVLRSGLLGQMDLDAAFQILNSYVARNEFESKQEKLYALENLLYIKRSRSWERNETLYDKIDDLKNKGLVSIRENIIEIIKQFEKIKLEDVKPYNTSYSNRIGYSDQIKELGICLLNILAETGLSVRFHAFPIVKKEEWYNVFKVIYEDYPYPVLYYSLQIINDSGRTKLMARDFVNSEKLTNTLPFIWDMLIAAFFSSDTPQNWKINILYFLSELIVAIPSEKWESDFIDVWNDSLSKNKLFSDTWLEGHGFIDNGLRFIISSDSITLILKTLFDNRDKGDEVINYLNVLASRRILGRKRSKILDIELQEKIDDVIISIPDHVLQSMYLLGNINDLLDDERRRQIELKLNECNLNELNSNNIWHPISYFSKGNDTLIKSIKNAIVQSKYLFNSGIEIKDGRISSSQRKFIRIHRLRKRDSNPEGLLFNENEIKIIYDVLISELNKIEKKVSKGFDFEKFTDLLEEMLDFLDSNEDVLKSISTYTEILKLTQHLLQQERGYQELREGIIFKEGVVYYNALNELTRHLYQKAEIAPHQELFDFILAKIYIIDSKDLDRTLNVVSSWFRELISKDCLRPYGERMCNILDRHRIKDYKDCYKPEYFEYMVTIAMTLQYWEVKHKAIDYWIGIKESGRYNNLV
ncbi:MAG: hypothetical protein ACERKD_03050 [Prolixibacteraceae bacterium]